MAVLEDAIQIGLRLPGAQVNREDQVSCFVLVKGKPKGFFWIWRERVDPKKARVLNPNVIGVRTAGLAAKEFLLQARPEYLFTEDHYNGYPAVLVRLAEIPLGDLEDLILEGWKATAPKDLLSQI